MIKIGGKQKVCILSTTNLQHMTLISLYTKIFEDEKVDYDIIYFDRYGIKEDSSAKNLYVYTSAYNRSGSKLKKLKEYIKYRNYALRILKNNDYDLIIVWNTMTAFLFSNYLLKKPKKYILNIRDYFLEKNLFVYKIHEKLIKNSYTTTISSKGFLNFLPKSEYLYTHSFNPNLLNEENEKSLPTSKGDKIVIGFLGNNRFFDQGKNLMDALKNDKRFEMWFCGTNSDVLEKYAEENNIKNCKFMGRFNPEDTSKILMEFDIINNLFGNDSEAVKTLTSIRLYYGVFYKKTILVNKSTYMEKIVQENNLGISIDWSDQNLADEIYNQYNNLDREDFETKCNSFLKQIKRENELFDESIHKLIK
ncbi:capsular biosynthesis protein [uncultured Rossellomorea sp.]|uniref:capsular biosynthesis protein n=1 Tax=uncultured Rossellomorea sp. TaxID=2837549 RepID=UPI002602842A|nr:capsular biosynthesis protein [uncultured Rossellomorea sp.]